MRHILLLITAIFLAPTLAAAQPAPAKDLKPLFDMVQKLGTDTELRGDIAGRLGFGDEDLHIKDLVIKANGVQHAVNAFVLDHTSYLLFDSHLRVPEVYIFVKRVDGTLVSGIHGRQYEPITSTAAMTESDGAVVSAEEAFWRQWLADGAKIPQ